MGGSTFKSSLSIPHPPSDAVIPNSYQAHVHQKDSENQGSHQKIREGGRETKRCTSQNGHGPLRLRWEFGEAATCFLSRSNKIDLEKGDLLLNYLFLYPGPLCRVRQTRAPLRSTAARIRLT